MADNELITLKLGRMEAEQLVRAIYVLGENIAAGDPIPPMEGDFNEIVGAVYRRLLKELGR